jgi:hypothetical protein
MYSEGAGHAQATSHSLHSSLGMSPLPAFMHAHRAGNTQQETCSALTKPLGSSLQLGTIGDAALDRAMLPQTYPAL